MAFLSRLSAPLWHLYVLFALVPVLRAAANPLGYSGVRVRRFQRRLGLALGISLMGVRLGAAFEAIAAAYEAHPFLAEPTGEQNEPTFRTSRLSRMPESP